MSRFVRQQDIVPEEIHQCRCAIVGCGSIGSAVAEQLARLGVKKIVLIDPDKVEDHNVTNQGFTLKDIGQYKVAACRRKIQDIDPTIKTLCKNCKVQHLHYYCLLRSDCVFVCPDSIDVRSWIWENQEVELLIDGRMGGSNIHVLCVDPQNQESVDVYENSLFPASEAEEIACTAQGTIASGSICAGFMVSQFVRYMKHGNFEHRRFINLMNMKSLDMSPT